MHVTKTGILATTLVSMMSLSAQAAEFGLGAGLISDGGTIFLPIDVGTKLRIEPEISYAESDSGTTSGQDFETRQFSLGTGIYALKPIGEDFRSYFGARLGYIQNKSTFKYSNRPNDFSKSESDGFYIAPTLGGEYSFNEHFSIGLDVALLYQDLSSDSTSFGQQTSGDDNNFDTRTRATLRYYF